MKIEHFMILFACLLTSVLITVSYSVDVVTSANQLTLQYRKYLDTAVEGAIYEIEDIMAQRNQDYEDGIWDKETMQIAETEIVRALSLDFGGHITLINQELNQKLPAILFCDMDGYYVRYYEEVEDSQGFVNTVPVYTSKNFWSEEYDKCIISYTLSNDIRVIDMETGKIYEGNYKKVLEEMGNPQWLKDLTADENTFYQHKLNVITDRLENSMNVFVNHNNHVAESKGKSYYITLDRETNDMEKALDRPGLIAFFQGPVVNNLRKNVSVFAIASRQIGEPAQYPVTVDDSGYFSYHRKDCVTITNENKIGEANSVVTAADMGAFPCAECNP